MPAEERKLDVVEREQAIFRYLRGIDRAVGATVRELHEHLTVTGAAVQARPARCATRSRCRRTTSWSPGWCWTAGSSRSATRTPTPSGTRSRPRCTPTPR